jgi:hypothetical protein
MKKGDSYKLGRIALYVPSMSDKQPSETDSYTSSRFQRRVFQISPEDHEPIQNTTKKAFSHLNTISEKKVLSTETPHVPRHRDVYFPFLIKIFSLQEQIRNYQSGIYRIFPVQSTQKPLEEIQNELTHIVKEIEESQRWNEAVIAKAKKALGDLSNIASAESQKQPSFPWIKKILHLMKRRSWIKKSPQ